MNISDIAVLNIYGADYRCIISGSSKDEAINLEENANWIDKKGKIIEPKNTIITFKNG